ncbi:DUF4286 family protein [Bosea sp. (in: a-proteobacteria)]|uniref:DUF4286 family protein n=1 Tax=Bosea sp. (in: a-proteobacteria) TaxID=1871050 RepID=UPI00262C91ED|nr:DUF4286 family protein [Bosea sp. (in: a-proteobacteria)]MCO5090355.1 hypothetical protein [Bosea sp. (in: a-proteobacteria)]
MALAGDGVLAIWNGIEAAAEADFLAWHIREHIPERVAVAGFNRGRRYIAERGRPKYFNFYEVDSTQTLVSPDYVARLNAPSAWTKRVVRHFLDTSRTICHVVSSRGVGDGGYVGTLKFDLRGPRAEFLHRVEPVLSALHDAPSVVAVHLLEGQGGGSNGQTAEKDLRKQPDATVDWLLIIEAVDRAALEAAVAEHLPPDVAARLGAGFEPDADYGIYRLQYGLSKAQLA